MFILVFFFPWLCCIIVQRKPCCLLIIAFSKSENTQNVPTVSTFHDWNSYFCPTFFSKFWALLYPFFFNGGHLKVGIWVYTVCQCPFYGMLGLNVSRKNHLIKLSYVYIAVSLYLKNTLALKTFFICLFRALTLKGPITAAEDNIFKYFIFDFQSK